MVSRIYLTPTYTIFSVQILAKMLLVNSLHYSDQLCYRRYVDLQTLSETGLRDWNTWEMKRFLSSLRMPSSKAVIGISLEPS